MRARLFVASLLLPAAALAAVEVTPQIGYRSGGLEFNTGIACVQSPCPSYAEADDRALFGAVVGVPINDRLRFEVLANRQSTDLAFSDSIAGPRNGLPGLELEVTHLHAGISRLWELSSFQPFVVIGAGRSFVETGQILLGPVDLELWSGSLGGGVRVPFGSSDRFGLRLEARGYWVEDVSTPGLGDDFQRALQSDLDQVETTAGVTIRF